MTDKSLSFRQFKTHSVFKYFKMIWMFCSAISKKIIHQKQYNIFMADKSLIFVQFNIHSVLFFLNWTVNEKRI